MCDPWPGLRRICLSSDRLSQGDDREATTFFSPGAQDTSNIYVTIFYLVMTYPRHLMKNIPGWLFS